jgi:hypothetical protein
MTTTDDLMGGEWEQEARSLHVAADGWIRGHHVPTAIHSVRNYARIADTLGNRGGLQQLADALGKLDLEIERYQHRLSEFRREVGLMRGFVFQARDKMPDGKTPAERQDAIDDATVERIASYYNPRAQQGWWRD